MVSRFARMAFANSKKITVIGALVLSLIVPASSSFADDITTSVSAGSKAVLFSFSGLSILGANAFDGGIGAKYYFSDPLAVRAGIQFMTAGQGIAANPAATQQGTDGSISATRFGISAAAEYHLLKTRVSPYFGGGLGLTLTSTERKTAEVGNPPANQTITKNNFGVGAADGETINGNTFLGGTKFSIGAIGGVEFFIIKELSLSAEYQLGWSLTSRADEEVTTGSLTTKTKVGSTWQVGVAALGALTLAFYF